MRMEINQFYLNEHDEQKHFFEKKKWTFIQLKSETDLRSLTRGSVLNWWWKLLSKIIFHSTARLVFESGFQQKVGHRREWVICQNESFESSVIKIFIRTY